MSRFRLLFVSGTVIGLSVLLSGCGSSAAKVKVPPSASYALNATALNPPSVSAGGAATSTITVTPANGYTGSVTLSCSSITGGGTPAPTCAFAASPAVIAGNGAVTSLADRDLLRAAQRAPIPSPLRVATLISWLPPTVLRR